jgi:hypothetical protein
MGRVRAVWTRACWAALSAAAAAGVVRPAWAGAWTAESGASYQRFAFSAYSAREAFGDAQGFDSFRDFTASYYGEFGAAEGVTVFAALPLRQIENRNFGFPVRNAGAGDVDLGVRVRLLARPLVLSGQLTFKAPYLYDAGAALPLGNGQEDAEARLLAGRSLGRFGYVGAEIAYRRRFGAPTDEFRYLLEHGADLGRRAYVRTKLDVTQALASTAAFPDAQTGNPRFPLAFNLARLESTLGWRFGRRVALEASAVSNPFGANTIRGLTAQGALVITLDPRRGRRLSPEKTAASRGWRPDLTPR